MIYLKVFFTAIVLFVAGILLCFMWIPPDDPASIDFSKVTVTSFELTDVTDPEKPVTLEFGSKENFEQFIACYNGSFSKEIIKTEEFKNGSRDISLSWNIDGIYMLNVDGVYEEVPASTPIFIK